MPAHNNEIWSDDDNLSVLIGTAAIGTATVGALYFLHKARQSAVGYFYPEAAEPAVNTNASVQSKTQNKVTANKVTANKALGLDLINMSYIAQLRLIDDNASSLSDSQQSMLIDRVTNSKANLESIFTDSMPAAKILLLVFAIYFKDKGSIFEAALEKDEFTCHEIMIEGGKKMLECVGNRDYDGAITAYDQTAWQINRQVYEEKIRRKPEHTTQTLASYYAAQEEHKDLVENMKRQVATIMAYDQAGSKFKLR